jgi:phage host-nuclease inhibitor protein Gam
LTAVATKSKRRRATADPPIPRDARAANLCIALIGEAQRERIRLQTELNRAIERLRARYGKSLAARTMAIARMVASLRTWCDEYRRRHRRPPVFATGEVAWQRRRPGRGEAFVVRPFDTGLKELG